MRFKTMIFVFLFLFVVGCVPPLIELKPTFIPPSPIALETPPTDETKVNLSLSQPEFQVFILNPVRTCLTGNDFASGSVCFGEKCGDCSCQWDEFDPPAPMTGILPDQINSPKYAEYAYRECFEITLTDKEIEEIQEDMLHVQDLVYEWSQGSLDLQMKFTILPHDFTGFVAPDFVIGPFKIDDELLDPYVDSNTDFVYVVNGVLDREKGVNLAFGCGGSYGEMGIHGAGFTSIQYNSICNHVVVDSRKIYEPLIHEWYHNLDWALYNLVLVPDAFQKASPNWGGWTRGPWPGCGTVPDPSIYFPSIDYCEWDPDWIDCNNVASAGRCKHASEVNWEISWYEHVIRAHYPVSIQFIGNTCRDGRQDFGETGIDVGGSCPSQ